MTLILQEYLTYDLLLTLPEYSRIDTDLTNINTQYLNLLFNGIDSSCKDIIIDNFLINTYKNYKTKTLCYKIKTGKTVKYNASQYHYEIDIHKKNYILVHNIIDIIKDLTAIRLCTEKPKYIILKNFDHLPTHIQHGFKRLIEQTYHSYRYILTTSSITILDSAIISRMLIIRIPKLKKIEIRNIIYKICKERDIQINETQVSSIIKKSECYIKKALLILEASFISNEYKDYIDSKTQIINTLVKYITSKIKDSVYLDIRLQILNIIKQNIDINTIFRDVTNKMIDLDFPDKIKIKIVELASNYQHNYSIGYKSIYHLEAFFFNLIKIYHCS